MPPADFHSQMAIVPVLCMANVAVSCVANVAVLWVANVAVLSFFLCG
jgi:hypothetical protein